MEYYTTKDGYKWEIKTKKEAQELFENDLKLYIISKVNDTERLVYSEEDFNNIHSDEFYVEECEQEN